MRRKNKPDQSGIAIILVVFLITLATIVVYAQAKSSYIGSRLIKTSEQQLQSEFLLKSSLNFARALIAADKGLTDPPKDKLWGMFADAKDVPLSILGLDIPGAVLTLEIRAEDSKLPIRQLFSSLSAGAVGGSNKWEEYFLNLFKKLDFDNDKQEVKSGKFKGQFFNSERLLANLIDYMDSDNDSFKGDSVVRAKGIEGDLEDKFPNTAPEKINELFQIPGFTDQRVRMLADHISFSPNLGRVNINFASAVTIAAIDKTSDDADIDKLIAEREANGPFDQNKFNIVGQQYLKGFSQVSGDLNVGTKYFQVIAKVQYGDSRYFLRAYLERNPNNGQSLPDVKSYELIG